MIEMLYVLLLEIILITYVGCQYKAEKAHDYSEITVEKIEANKNDTIANDWCTNLMFTREVEDIYRAHGLLVGNAIASTPVRPFGSAVRNIRKKSLRFLLQKAASEIRQYCSDPDMRQAFQQAHQIEQSLLLRSRMQLWFDFVTKIVQTQKVIRARQLPQVWFPINPNEDNEKKFLIKNADLVLSKQQKQYLMADTVMSFLPFAIIAQHDPESFSLFAQAR